MNTKSFLKAAVVALTLTTISGLPSSVLSSSASAGVTLNNADHEAKAIKVIEASIEALGGRDKLSKIKYLKQNGTIAVPMAGIEGTIELSINSPYQLLITIDIPMLGQTIQGLKDGVVWSSDAMNGPRLVSEEEARDIIKQANLLTVLNYVEDHSTIEYAEEVEFDGQTAHKIRLVDREGNESFKYFSIESGLEIGVEAEAMTQMGKIMSVTKYQEYKELGGYLQPTKILQKAGMTNLVFTISTSSYSEIDESVFEFPAAIIALIEATKEQEEAAP